MSKCDLIMPELGLDDQPMKISLWLAAKGDRVAHGQPVLEIVAGNVTVDLPSPADGTLVKKFVGEDDPVQVGQRLAVIEDRLD